MKTIYKVLQDNNKTQETLLLFIMCITCFTLSLFRVYFTGSKTYLFLNFNLFLAFIPWAISTTILHIEVLLPKLKNKKIMHWMALISWLLFFPNAPYILTDLFHLQHVQSMPVWFDLTLILTFAWTGLMLGFISLRNIEAIFSKSISPRAKHLLIIALLFLTSFGVYLGRFLRWNSWDILQDPLGLMSTIGHRLVYPMEHPRTWGMTLFFGIFLNLAYWSLKYLQPKSIKKITLGL